MFLKLWLMLLYSICARFSVAHVKTQRRHEMSQSKMCFLVFPASLYLCTDRRMQGCSSPITKLAGYLVINRSVNEILGTSWRRLCTFATKCPRDARDGDWMLIRDPVKFPRSAWSYPEGSELPKKRGPLPISDAKRERKWMWERQEI